MDRAAKLTVYDDGNCPFCQWAQGWVARRDREHRMEFRDFNRPEVAAETPFSPRELGRRMHVRTAGGDWRIGFFGWIEVLSALPRWRWLAGLMRVPPSRWAGPLVYQFIADHRYQFPRFLLRWLGAPPPCDPPAPFPRNLGPGMGPWGGFRRQSPAADVHLTSLGFADPPIKKEGKS